MTMTDTLAAPRSEAPGALARPTRDTRTPYQDRAGLSTAASSSQEGAVGLAKFRSLLRQLFDCQPKQADRLFAEAKKRMLQAANPQRYIDELLDACVARRSENGIYLATDILADTGDLALEYALDFRFQDVERWSDEPETRYHPHDDVWTILLRAAGRANKTKDEYLLLLETCLSAGNRGIRESVVDGLQALATDKARAILTELANADPDPLIVRLAREALTELGSK